MPSLISTVSREWESVPVAKVALPSSKSARTRESASLSNLNIALWCQQEEHTKIRFAPLRAIYLCLEFPIGLIALIARICHRMPIHEALIRIAKGEVFDDPWSRRVYSVDASHYEVIPEAIVCPVDSGDIQAVCRFSSANRRRLSARGAGTGLLGQSLSDGIILDLTKHMNRIVEVGDDYVVTQPGIVKGVLDRELLKKGKFLPADPASSNYCTIGGMIANNSSGIHCHGYGNTIDFLEGVRLVYADGSEGVADCKSWDPRMASLKELLLPEREMIRNGYPDVAKNSCGYRLDSAIQHGKFHPHKVVAASEGTLGIVTESRFRILDLPEQRSLFVIGFPDIQHAISVVPAILKFSPVALEMMDHSVISAGTGDIEKGCLLFVEFAGKRSVADRRFESCMDKVRESGAILEYASDEASLEKVWAARKGALNNIMKLTVGSRRPIGLIEDTVVPVENLQQHLHSILEEYQQHHLDYVLYGHVGDGNLHTRPLINLESEGQVRTINEIASNVFRRVAKYKGSITGEHGDGIARTPYVEMLYGKSITQLFRRVKELFDPQLLLNPGKKVPELSPG